jgi:hypothetical protein
LATWTTFGFTAGKQADCYLKQTGFIFSNPLIVEEKMLML